MSLNKKWQTSGGCNIIKVLGGRSNVFLLTKGQFHVLIDTSAAFMWPLLKKRLDSLMLKKIDFLVLTHSHFDHAANAKRIKEIYNAKVILHPSEIPYLTTGDNILPNGTNSFTRSLVKVFAKKFKSFALYEPCNYDFTIDEIADFSPYGMNASIIHTPGHTQGSISIIVDHEIAIVGDTLFGVFPWTAFPPFAANADELMKSWSRLLQTKCRLFMPSHGLAITRTLLEKDFYKRAK